MEIVKNSKTAVIFKKAFGADARQTVSASIRGCFIYRLLTGVMSWISRAFTGCFIYRILSEKDPFTEGMQSSFLFGLINKIIQGVISFFSRVYSFFAGIDADSLNRRAFNAVTERFHLTYVNFVGFVFILISVVPGDKWNNAYGLGAAFIMTLIYIVGLFAQKGYRNDIRGFSFSMMIFMLTSFIAAVTSVDRADSFRVLTFFVTSFLFMLVIGGCLTDEEKTDKFTGFIFAAVLITSVICIIQSIVGIEFDSQLVDVNTSGNISRAYSTFENPNNYAEYLVMLLPFAAAFALNRKSKKEKAISLLLLAVPFAALILTYSRSCWVSFAIALVVFILLYDYKLVPYLIFICVIALPLLPSTIGTRISTIGDMGDTSNHYRVEIWDGALRMIKKWGLTGTGLGPMAFTKIYKSYAVPSAITAPHSHMLFLEIFLEAGIISILSFIIWWLMTLRRCITALISKKNISSRVRNVLIASIASFTSMIFVSGVEYIWFYPRVMITFFVMAGVTFAAIKNADQC